MRRCWHHWGHVVYLSLSSTIPAELERWQEHTRCLDDVLSHAHRHPGTSRAQGRSLVLHKLQPVRIAIAFWFVDGSSLSLPERCSPTHHPMAQSPGMFGECRLLYEGCRSRSGRERGCEGGSFKGGPHCTCENRACMPSKTEPPCATDALP